MTIGLDLIEAERSDRIDPKLLLDLRMIRPVFFN